jgi:hypothetical protein
MVMRRALPFLVVTLACYRPAPQIHAGAEATRVADAPADTAADQLCRATVKGTDVSDWEEIAAEGFTFCVPSDGHQLGDTWRSGTTRLAWGTAPMGYSSSDPAVFANRDVFAPHGQSFGRSFREVIGGQKAYILLGHDNRVFTAAARWNSAWLTAESSMLPNAEAMQLAIFRTVRFVDRAK